ncbi:MAG: 6-phosphogluconate dehydrogenase, partial [Flavobacteriaceae bacterium]|nr:6-phosphogluconate dehydrogenase [Flavobacteriaceae bacterium]
MKKILFIILGSLLALYLLYFAFVTYVPYSEGTRAGELIKFSNKGVLFKTWEGEISQGISGAQIFQFSV